MFASALDWPGWTRSGKTEQAALEALQLYAPRYGRVAGAARLPFPSDPRFEVAERVKGNATTDFGAPAMPTRSDSKPLAAAEAERQGRLLAAAWATLDQAVAHAPAELRKGPRGGGRDRDQIREHVDGAETAYAGKIGLRLNQTDHKALLEVLSAPSDGSPLKPGGWLSRYTARRIAWHALDHAWEIEDRSE